MAGKLNRTDEFFFFREIVVALRLERGKRKGVRNVLKYR